MEVLAFLRGPLRYAERLIGHDAALRTLAHWRVWLYDCLTPRVPAALVGWRSGDLLTRAIDDVDTLQDLYLRTMLPLGVAAGAATLGLVVVGLSLPLAALALGIPLLVACTVPPALVWHAAADEEDTALAGEISAHVVDIIHGAPELLAFGADAAALDRVDEMSREAEALGAAPEQSGCPGLLHDPALPGRSADRRPGGGRVGRAQPPPQPRDGGRPSPGRPGHVRTRARHHPGRLPRPGRTSRPPVGSWLSKPFRFRSAIRWWPVHCPEGVPDLSFARASLRYAPELPLALDEVTVRVAPGERLAVTGSSGAGKSSLVNALLRFWPLESGTLRLGDVPSDELTQSDVRSACALVDQRAQMFAGTLRSNVTLGRPDASDAEIATVLDAAQLSAWVAALPAGLETPVGEDGVSISGGERRRLAVARALLAGGPILLLDEPTAGLDTRQADQLTDDVLAAAVGRSVLLITHRAAEADKCQRTISMEAGRIID